MKLVNLHNIIIFIRPANPPTRLSYVLRYLNNDAPKRESFGVPDGED